MIIRRSTCEIRLNFDKSRTCHNFRDRDDGDGDGAGDREAPIAMVDDDTLNSVDDIDTREHTQSSCRRFRVEEGSGQGQGQDSGKTRKERR
jgi:hypothetical protein